MSKIGIAATLLLAAAAAFASDPPRRRAVPKTVARFCDSGTDVTGVTVPADFCVRKFADVPVARVMGFAPNGDLFVSSPKRVTPGGAGPGAGAIFLLRESTPGGVLQKFTFAQGLQTVHGILVTSSAFYYTLEQSVLRVPYAAGATSIDTSTPEVIATFDQSASYARWTHSLAMSTDGALLVSRGVFDNQVCPPADDRNASVLRIGSGHSAAGDIVARGFRNPLTLRCMPWSTCYAIELSGDGWTAAGGAEKLVELHDGDNYGFPCCVARDVPAPELGNPPPNCSTITVADHTFPLHDTPFGFDWERNFGWPDPYRNGFFVGLHGDYGSWTHAGMQWAPTDPVTHLPTKATTEFLTGVGQNKTISRIADVRFAPDGRLFFTDDHGGAVYWIAPRSLKIPAH